MRENAQMHVLMQRGTVLAKSSRTRTGGVFRGGFQRCDSFRRELFTGKSARLSNANRSTVRESLSLRRYAVDGDLGISPTRIIQAGNFLERIGARPSCCNGA